MPAKTLARGRSASATRAKPVRSQKAYSSRLLDRSVLLLRILATGSVEKRLSDFSEAGLHKSTAFRLLEALRRHRLVAVDEVTGRYRLGLGLFELGMAAVSRLDVGQCAPPFLDALAAETGESASLGIFEDPEVVHILRVESAHPLRLPSLAGRRSPAYCTGIGKAILAHLEPERLETYLRNVTLKPRTPRTITDRAALHLDLRRIRARGFSVDDEEIYTGLRCVAAPVFGLDGRVVAGVSVAGPTSRMPKDSLLRFSNRVLATASEISRRLGFRPAPGASDRG
ncbi:MAG: IclR family transcriptional regulator [Vicinamibacteria bacterium]